MKNRLYFLDNLRSLMIFFVVMYHSAIVYQIGFDNTWIVSDPIKNKSIGLLGIYLDIFVMFIVFFIAGYFTSLSIKKKNSRGYLKKKCKRILVPWGIAVLTLIPIYKYLFLYSRGLPQEAWTSYFHWFLGRDVDVSMFSNSPNQSWLWFLPMLFLFHIIYLGLLKTGLLKKLSISIEWALILFFILGLTYSKVISIMDLRGWYHSLFFDFQRERLLIYLMAFLLGTLFHKKEAFDNYKRNLKVFIWVNVTLSLTITIYTSVTLNFFFNIVYPGREYYFITKSIDNTIYYASSLLCMLSFLYVFLDLFLLKFNHKPKKLVKYLNKGSYTVYIIHIIVIGFLAIPLQSVSLPSIVKFFILTIGAYFISQFIAYIYSLIKKKR